MKNVLFSNIFLLKAIQEMLFSSLYIKFSRWIVNLTFNLMWDDEFSWRWSNKQNREAILKLFKFFTTAKQKDILSHFARMQSPKGWRWDRVINVTLCEKCYRFHFMFMYLLIWYQCGVKSGWGKLNESNFTWIQFIFAFRWTFYIFRISQYKAIYREILSVYS